VASRLWPGVESNQALPHAPLEDAYANTVVDVKYDTDGTSISCASQPEIVAIMLERLDARPGERILELGAGTGYNAALLAHLVGETGHVTTIDVDDDLVEGVRAHLAVAGVTNVEALTRDGALGHAEGAPYDRIIATVGAHGIPRAWLDQLAPGGRLVVPSGSRAASPAPSRTSSTTAAGPASAADERRRTRVAAWAFGVLAGQGVGLDGPGAASRGLGERFGSHMAPRRTAT
jgi:protein-L-isoaspartate(D-aspartate) O-methyltransferase